MADTTKYVPYEERQGNDVRTSQNKDITHITKCTAGS